MVSLVTSYISRYLFWKSGSPRKTNKQKRQARGGGGRYKKKRPLFTEKISSVFSEQGSRGVSEAWSNSFFVVFCLFLCFSSETLSILKSKHGQSMDEKL